MKVIQNFKKPRRNPSEIDFLTLSDYRKIAKDIVARILAKRKRTLLIRITSNEDYMSEIIQAVINADWTFDEAKSALTTWRIKYVKWAISSIAANMKNLYVSQDQPLMDVEQQEIPNTYSDRTMGRAGHKMYKTKDDSLDEDLDELLKNTRLSPREWEIFTMSRQMSRTEIANKLNITKQAISLMMISAINKIRTSNGITVTTSH